MIYERKNQIFLSTLILNNAPLPKKKKKHKIETILVLYSKAYENWKTIKYLHKTETICKTRDMARVFRIQIKDFNSSRIKKEYMDYNFSWHIQKAETSMIIEA